MTHVVTTETWTAKRVTVPKPCIRATHHFAPTFQGETARRGLLEEVYGYDVCECGSHRFSEVMAWVAFELAEVATS